MELIEREGFLNALLSQFERSSAGEGHCIFISGEAGIGKTSLTKAFIQKVKSKSKIFHGTCDALFSPRPLAPLYDILLQLKNDIPENNSDVSDRSALFSKVLYELKKLDEPNVVFF